MANDEKALQFIEDMTRNADAVQQDVIAQILTQNAQTEYLIGCNLNGATDRETFKSKIPIVTYEDIQPSIQRIANGDRSPILSAHPITEFLTSSGTSGGERKLIPSTKEELDRRMFFQSLRKPIINQYIKGLDNGKALDFYFTKPGAKTPSGIPAHTAISSVFINGGDEMYNIFTSPKEAILCTDTFQSMYIQMLCGLYEREQVIRIGSAFASTLLQAIRLLQLNWEQLTHDIRTGSLNPRVTDDSIRKCMNHVMQRPDPDLADLIAHECSQENWEGILTRIWHNMKYVDVIVTGSMAQYIPTLNYYSGGLPIVSMFYVSSEGPFGLNLNPICDPYKVSYTIMPNMAYFEFLPYEPNSVGPLKTMDLVDVEIDKEYEIVVTIFAGLYRYRIGDILQVTGFHNSAPQFKFLKRKNMLLSVDVDKTDEGELQTAVDNASQLLREFNVGVVEYTSYADTSTIPGHYVLYWELLAKEPTILPSDEVQDQCCLAIEESLNSVYRQCRVQDKSIGPLEIRTVKNGTFEELMEYAMSRGASISQYKVPRCVSSTPIIKLLDSRVISTHFSPSLPHWTPLPRR